MLVRTPLHSKLLAEFVGTGALCAAGLGTALGIGGEVDGAAKLLAVAFAHGLAIAVMVTAVGHTSGGHLNPAVTVAAMATRQKGLVEGLAYIAAQIAGGIAGSALIKGAYGDRWTDKDASVALADGVTLGQGILLEALATFFLVWVVFAVAVDRDGAWFRVAGLPIGFAVTMGILMIGPLTGATLNPVRWLGPNVLTGEFADAMAWIAGPLAGGLLAGFMYMYLMRPRLNDPV